MKRLHYSVAFFGLPRPRHGTTLKDTCNPLRIGNQNTTDYESSPKHAALYASPVPFQAPELLLAVSDEQTLTNLSCLKSSSRERLPFANPGHSVNGSESSQSKSCPGMTSMRKLHHRLRTATSHNVRLLPTTGGQQVCATGARTCQQGREHSWPAR